jgi:hypothetical protein
MARGFRTKIDPFTWNLERHSTPGATLDFDEFTALEHDTIGIRLASEGARAVKCHDTKCDAKSRCKMRCKTRCKMRAQPDWPEPDFAYEPCFSGRPRRGKIENCPSPRSLRNQAPRRNDIPGHMTRKSRNTTRFTLRYLHFRLRLGVLHQLIYSIRVISRQIGLVS